MLIRHNEDDLDKVFRQKLYDVEEESPLHLWEGIRQRVPQRKRIIVWRWLLPLLMFIGGAAVWASYSYVQSLPSTAQAVSTAAIAAPEQGLVQHATLTPYKAQDGHTISHDDSPAFTSAASTKMNGAEDSSRTADGTHLILAGEENSLHRKETARQVAYTKSNNRKEITRPGSSSQKVVPIRDIEEHEPLTQIKQQPEETGAMDIGISEFVLDSLWMRYDSLYQIPQIEERVFAESLEKEVFANTLPYIASPSSQPARFSVGAYYTLAQPMRVVRNGAADAAYTNLKHRTDMHLAHGVGVQTSYRLFGNWEISGALEYQRFNERHRWSDTTMIYERMYYIGYDTTYSETDIHVIPVLLDSLVSQSMSVKEQEVNNRYTNIQMPLILRWSHYHKNYSIGLEAGAVLHLQSIYKGGFTNVEWIPLILTNPIGTTTPLPVTEYQYQSKTTAPLQQVYKDWRTDLHLGIHQSYRFASHWSASLVLQTRMMLNKDDAPRQAHHRIVQPGVRVGLNYYIR